MPSKIKGDEYREAQIFMNDGEKALWSSSYKKDMRITLVLRMKRN